MKRQKVRVDCLNQGQSEILKEAINWYYNSPEQVFRIDGKAGTGKSYLIGAILQSLNLGPSQYYAMAYTGQAAIVMRTRGFSHAKSIHSTLYEYRVVKTDRNEDYSNDSLVKKFGNTYRRGEFCLKKELDDWDIRLFFIDEASMVPDYMVKDILSFGVKVIVCGDLHQLPPIHGHGSFLTCGKVWHLTELMRQTEDSPIIWLAERASNGEPIHEGQYGNVLVINQNEVMPEMFNYGQCVVCGTNATRDYLNGYIREMRGFRGILPNYGERLICRKNNWKEEIDHGISLANGLCGTVTMPPDASKFSGRTFRINFKPDVTNGEFQFIKCSYDYLTGNLQFKESLRNLSNPASRHVKGEFFDYAYAITTHLSQGGEFFDGVYIEEPFRAQEQCQLNYTGITRFKRSLIYVKRVESSFYVPKTVNDNILYKGEVDGN